MIEAVKPIKRPINRGHVFDEPETWARGDFRVPPWSAKQIAAFQKRIDSAFGAKNAIVLIWNGDRSYGDRFYEGPWDVYGEPLGSICPKPLVMFGQFPINDGKDYIIVSPARWVLAEVHHGSQLEDGWADSAYVADESFLGGRKRIREIKPPEFYYVPLLHGTLETHLRPFVTGDEPPCCRELWNAKKKICYGKYREPNDSDIARIKQIRIRMDKDGFAQRSDTKRDAKAILNASLATKHFMKQASIARSRAAANIMLSDPSAFMGDILKLKGSTMSKVEMERIVTKALQQDEEERFSEAA